MPNFFLGMTFDEVLVVNGLLLEELDRVNNLVSSECICEDCRTALLKRKKHLDNLTDALYEYLNSLH